MICQPSATPTYFFSMPTVQGAPAAKTGAAGRRLSDSPAAGCKQIGYYQTCGALLTWICDCAPLPQILASKLKMPGMKP